MLIFSLNWRVYGKESNKSEDIEVSIFNIISLHIAMTAWGSSYIQSFLFCFCLHTCRSSASSHTQEKTSHHRRRSSSGHKTSEDTANCRGEPSGDSPIWTKYVQCNSTGNIISCYPLTIEMGIFEFCIVCVFWLNLCVWPKLWVGGR